MLNPVECCVPYLCCRVAGVASVVDSVRVGDVADVILSSLDTPLSPSTPPPTPLDAILPAHMRMSLLRLLVRYVT